MRTQKLKKDVTKKNVNVKSIRSEGMKKHQNERKVAKQSRKLMGLAERVADLETRIKALEKGKK